MRDRFDLFSDFRFDVLLAAIPSRHEKVVHHELAEGEVVLLHLESGAYHELNHVGALIWKLVDGERDVPGIVREVRSRVEDPPEDLEAEIAGFLTDLRDRNLIR